MESVVCFECRGSGLIVNPAEMQSIECKRCGGSGKLSKIDIKDLIKLVKSDYIGIFEPVLQKYREIKGEK